MSSAAGRRRRARPDHFLGAAAVSIDGATVRGIRDLPLSTLRSSLAVLRNPFKPDKAVAFTFERFQYKEFPGRSHFTAGEPGWEEVADFALGRATEHARAGVRVHT